MSKAEKKETEKLVQNKTYKKGDKLIVPVGHKKSINGIVYSAGKHIVRS